MILIDTNIIIRYLAGDVPLHQDKSRLIFESILNGNETGIILHNVLHEACYVLTSSTESSGYNYTHRETRDLLLPLLASENLKVIPDKQLAIEALDIFAQGERIDFIDALLVVYVGHGLARAIYSFDKRLDKIEGANRINPLNL